MLWRLGSHTSPLPSRRPPRIPAWKHARSCCERLDLGREKGRIWAGNNARLGQEMGQDLDREQGKIGAGLGWDLGRIRHSCPSAPLATGCSLPAPSALPVQAQPWHHVNPCVHGQLPGKQFHSPQDARSAHPHAPRRHKTPRCHLGCEHRLGLGTLQLWGKLRHQQEPGWPC